MAEYGCSRMTVNKALSALAATGLIARRRRAGSVRRRAGNQRAVLRDPGLSRRGRRAPAPVPPQRSCITREPVDAAGGAAHGSSRRA